MEAVELFAGGGGLLLGCSLAGFSHRAAYEWNRDSCDTLRANVAADYPLVRGTSVVMCDVRDVAWDAHASQLDLLAGGPPCQPFSIGGLARSADDPRDMFPAFARALAALRPRAFIVENVRGLTRSSFAEYYSYILLRLQYPEIAAQPDETWIEHLTRLSREHTSGAWHDLSYRVAPTIVDAADYGVPQHRHRVFIVGFRSDVEANWSFPAPTHSGAALKRSQESGEYWERHGIPQALRSTRPLNRGGDPLLLPWVTVRDALADIPTPSPLGVSGWLNHVLVTGAKSYPGHTGSSLDEPSKAIKAGVHGVPGGENTVRLDDGSLRYYTVREAARIQCFPDRYEFSGAWGEAMRQVGNAVPVRLAQVVASSVALSLRHDEAMAGMERELSCLMGDQRHALQRLVTRR